MSVAFYDYDIYLKKSKIILNLEAMKIASYYKNKGEALYLIDDPKKANEYDKAFIFRNVMPKRSLTSKTIDFIEGKDITHLGYAYTGGIYIPTEQKYEIETAWPQIYWSYFRNKINEEKLTIAQVEKLLNSHYIRLRTGKSFLKLDGMTQKNRVFIYDAEIERVPDWELKLNFISKELSKEKKIQVINKFNFYSPEELLKFTKIPGFTSDDVRLFYNCSYKEFEDLLKQLKGWCSSRNGIHYEFGNLRNPGSLIEAIMDFVLSINKYFLAKSMGMAVIFDVSDASDSSEINRMQKAFQYWTDIRVGDESLKTYFKRRLNKDFDEIYNLILKSPYGQQFEYLCNITKNDIKSKGWYYRG